MKKLELGLLLGGIALEIAFIFPFKLGAIIIIVLVFVGILLYKLIFQTFIKNMRNKKTAHLFIYNSYLAYQSDKENFLNKAIESLNREDKKLLIEAKDENSKLNILRNNYNYFPLCLLEEMVKDNKKNLNADNLKYLYFYSKIYATSSFYDGSCALIKHTLYQILLSGGFVILYKYLFVILYEIFLANPLSNLVLILFILGNIAVVFYTWKNIKDNENNNQNDIFLVLGEFLSQLNMLTPFSALEKAIKDNNPSFDTLLEAYKNQDLKIINSFIIKYHYPEVEETLMLCYQLSINNSLKGVDSVRIHNLLERIASRKYNFDKLYDRVDIAINFILFIFIFIVVYFYFAGK